jgi:hypothetical protein
MRTRRKRRGKIGSRHPLLLFLAICPGGGGDSPFRAVVMVTARSVGRCEEAMEGEV